jgi:anti-anti-sigma factor
MLILAVSGKLGAMTSKKFEDKILGDIDSGDRRFIIDLSLLEYISSSGLRVFLLAAKRLQHIGEKIARCSFKDHIREVFDFAAFSSFFSSMIHARKR